MYTHVTAHTYTHVTAHTYTHVTAHTYTHVTAHTYTHVITNNHCMCTVKLAYECINHYGQFAMLQVSSL